MDPKTVLKIIILISLFLLLSVALFVAVRRLIRGIYFLKLDRERERLQKKIEMFLEGKVMINAAELKFPEKSIRWQAVEDLLLKARESAGNENRIRITKLLEKLGYPAFYQRILRSGNRWQRSLAADRLGRMGSESSTRYLLEALNDPKKEVRSVALRSLGMLSDPRAFPFLMTRLPRITTEEGVFASTLKNTLISLGESVIPSILSRLEECDEEMQALLIECLGEIGSKRASGALIQKLTHPNPEIRAKSARALGKIGDPLAVPSLIELGEDKVWFVRLQVCRALGMIGDIKAIDFLSRRLTDENWQVRAAAAASLRQLGFPAFSALINILRNGQDRYAKEQIAEEMQRSGMVDELIDSIEHPEEERRQLSKQFLLMLAHLGITSLMEHASISHPSERVRREVRGILNLTQKE